MSTVSHVDGASWTPETHTEVLTEQFAKPSQLEGSSGLDFHTSASPLPKHLPLHTSQSFDLSGSQGSCGEERKERWTLARAE